MPPIVSKEYKEKKKKDLLESALVCFAEKGFQAATVDDIVAQSGMSKGAIYNYFKSKEEIYIELMNSRTEALFTSLQGKFKELHTATDKIKLLFKNYYEKELDQHWKNVILVHTEFMLHSSRDQELKNLMVERYKDVYRKFLVEIIEEGKKSGEFAQDINPEVIGTMFWVYIDGICMHYCVIGDEYPYRELMITAEEMILTKLKSQSF